MGPCVPHVWPLLFYRKRLLVLTSSQTACLLDVTAAPGETALKSAADPNR